MIETTETETTLADRIDQAYEQHMAAERRRHCQLDLAAQAQIKRAIRKALTWKAKHRTGRGAIPVPPADEWTSDLFDPAIEGLIIRHGRVDYTAHGDYAIDLEDGNTAVLRAFAERHTSNGRWVTRLYLRTICDECGKNETTRPLAVTSLGVLGRVLDGDPKAVCEKCRKKGKGDDQS